MKLGYANTPDTAGLVSEVTSFYHAYLGREPDAGGLDYWVSLIQSGAATISDVMNAISNSPESLDYFARVRAQQQALLDQIATKPAATSAPVIVDHGTSATAKFADGGTHTVQGTDAVTLLQATYPTATVAPVTVTGSGSAAQGASNSMANEPINPLSNAQDSTGTGPTLPASGFSLTAVPWWAWAALGLLFR